MLKQILAGSFILAVFFANTGATGANPRATLLLSQTQAVPSTKTDWWSYYQKDFKPRTMQF